MGDARTSPGHGVRPAEAVIELRPRATSQVHDSFDPSPLRESSLVRDVEPSPVECA